MFGLLFGGKLGRKCDQFASNTFDGLRLFQAIVLLTKGMWMKWWKAMSQSPNQKYP